MSKNDTKSTKARYLVVGALVFGAFFGAYQFAIARNAPSNGLQTAGNNTGLVQAADQTGSGGAEPACACCGSSAPTENGITGDPVEAEAVVTGDVQKIDVDVSQGFYNPNSIVLKAGVPAEITFGQGSGCTAQVMSNELGFFEDISNGPVTVKLPALDAGEYPFYCGMQMVFGKIVVK